MFVREKKTFIPRFLFVSVGLLHLTLEQTVWLVEQSPGNRSITLWHHADDAIDDSYVRGVTALRNQVEKQAVLYDLPNDALEKIITIQT